MSNIEKLSDHELIVKLIIQLSAWQIVTIARQDPQSQQRELDATVSELKRRLARNPRCPTCKKETDWHRGNCQACDAVQSCNAVQFDTEAPE